MIRIMGEVQAQFIYLRQIYSIQIKIILCLIITNDSFHLAQITYNILSIGIILTVLGILIDEVLNNIGKISEEDLNKTLLFNMVIFFYLPLLNKMME